MFFFFYILWFTFSLYSIIQPNVWYFWLCCSRKITQSSVFPWQSCLWWVYVNFWTVSVLLKKYNIRVVNNYLKIVLLKIVKKIHTAKEQRDTRTHTHQHLWSVCEREKVWKENVCWHLYVAVCVFQVSPRLVCIVQQLLLFSSIQRGERISSAHLAPPLSIFSFYLELFISWLHLLASLYKWLCTPFIFLSLMSQWIHLNKDFMFSLSMKNWKQKAFSEKEKWICFLRLSGVCRQQREDISCANGSHDEIFHFVGGFFRF